MNFLRLWCVALAIVGARPGVAQSALDPAAASDTLHGAAWHALYSSTRASHVAGRFREGLDGWRQLIAANPADAALWVNRGYASRALGLQREAADAFGHAVTLGTRSPQYTAMDASRAWAAVGDRDSTLTWLERALGLHLEQRLDMMEDPVFDAVRNDPRFRRLVSGTLLVPTDRIAGWRHDLDWLRQEATRHHATARREGLPPTFATLARQLHDSIPHLRDEAITVRIQRLLATLGDGHSLLYQQGPRALRQLPIGVYAFSDGLFIVRATDSLRHLVGARILSVGTNPPERVADRLQPMLSRDHEMEFRRSGTFWLLMPDVLQAMGIIESADSVRVRLQLRDGRELVVALVGGPAAPPMRRLPPPAASGPLPRYLRRAQEPFWLEAIPEHASLYVQFNRVDDAPGESLAAFARRLGIAARDSTVRSLIVDVRHNSGGNAGLLPPLLRALAAFVESDPSRRIFVIQGRGTFSAAQVFIAQVDRWIGATFAGEPSGSSPNFVGEDAPVRLPYSGLMVSISTRSHQIDDQDHRPFIVPRIPVTLSSSDYFANRDPVLDEVLAALSRR